jgi:hypothetical protein
MACSEPGSPGKPHHDGNVATLRYAKAGAGILKAHDTAADTGTASDGKMNTTGGNAEDKVARGVHHAT